MMTSLHKMEQTPKILTIVGLVFEGLSVTVMSLFAWMLAQFTDSRLYDLIEQDSTPEEMADVEAVFDILQTPIIVLAILMGTLLLINLFLFTRLIRGKYNAETAKKVYLYQAIIGGVNMMFNQVTGIVYLISGVMGYGGHKELTKRDIRDGI